MNHGDEKIINTFDGRYHQDEYVNGADKPDDSRESIDTEQTTPPSTRYAIPEVKQKQIIPHDHHLGEN